MFMFGARCGCVCFVFFCGRLAGGLIASFSRFLSSFTHKSVVFVEMLLEGIACTGGVYPGNLLVRLPGTKDWSGIHSGF